MTIKERAKLHRDSKLREMHYVAQKMNITKEKREESEKLWERIATQASESFIDGALFALVQIRRAIEDAPEDSDIYDVTYQKTVELLKGLT